jgi:hypothetical protein
MRWDSSGQWRQRDSLPRQRRQQAARRSCSADALRSLASRRGAAPIALAPSPPATLAVNALGAIPRVAQLAAQHRRVVHASQRRQRATARTACGSASGPWAALVGTWQRQQRQRRRRCRTQKATPGQQRLRTSGPSAAAVAAAAHSVVLMVAAGSHSAAAAAAWAGPGRPRQRRTVCHIAAAEAVTARPAQRRAACHPHRLPQPAAPTTGGWRMHHTASSRPLRPLQLRCARCSSAAPGAVPLRPSARTAPGTLRFDAAGGSPSSSAARAHICCTQICVSARGGDVTQTNHKKSQLR